MSLLDILYIDLVVVDDKRLQDFITALNEYNIHYKIIYDEKVDIIQVYLWEFTIACAVIEIVDLRLSIAIRDKLIEKHGLVIDS